MNGIVVGQVVFSKSGRDKGKYYLVVKIIDKNFAEIADGDIRKIEKPKKKKQMHLKATLTVLQNLKEKLENGKIVHNKEIISALKAFNAPEAVKPERRNAPETAKPSGRNANGEGEVNV